MFVIDVACYKLHSICLNSIRMSVDVRNTLEKLCVKLNMANTIMSAGESSCDEKHEKENENENGMKRMLQLL